VIIFSYRGLPQVKISQKVLGGYFFWLTLYSKQRETGCKLVLLTNRTSHAGFRLVSLPKLVTLNDLERRNYCRPALSLRVAELFVGSAFTELLVYNYKSSLSVGLSPTLFVCDCVCVCVLTRALKSYPLAWKLVISGYEHPIRNNSPYMYIPRQTSTNIVPLWKIIPSSKFFPNKFPGHPSKHFFRIFPRWQFLPKCQLTVTAMSCLLKTGKWIKLLTEIWKCPPHEI